jgi:hypothetical protein
MDCLDRKAAAADRAQHETQAREREARQQVLAKATWFGVFGTPDVARVPIKAKRRAKPIAEQPPPVESPPEAEEAATVTTYRRDRFGECWHLVPPGALGTHGRTLCGEPRQGSRLSETYADAQPAPPECICPRCTAADEALAATA